jgi:hypothetical protein
MVVLPFSQMGPYFRGHYLLSCTFLKCKVEELLIFVSYSQEAGFINLGRGRGGGPSFSINKKALLCLGTIF